MEDSKKDAEHLLTRMQSILDLKLAMLARADSTQTTRQKEAPQIGVLLFVARPGGFEPSTYRFVAGHSIH